MFNYNITHKRIICSSDGNDDVEENVVHGRATWKSYRRLLMCLDTRDMYVSMPTGSDVHVSMPTGSDGM